MILYHATFANRLSSILDRGLLPNVEHRNWAFSQEVVCLCSDEDVAASFCEAAEDASDEDVTSGIVILSISSKNLDDSLLKVDENVHNHDDKDTLFFAYHGVIAPKCIRKIRGYCL